MPVSSYRAVGYNGLRGDRVVARAVREDRSARAERERSRLPDAWSVGLSFALGLRPRMAFGFFAAGVMITFRTGVSSGVGAGAAFGALPVFGVRGDNAG